MVSFEEGHELLAELAGVEVPTKHVERAAEALGREVAEDERRVVEPPATGEPVAPRLYLGMDGTGVPVRKEELVHRPGKQPDGSAKTHTRARRGVHQLLGGHRERGAEGHNPDVHPSTARPPACRPRLARHRSRRAWPRRSSAISSPARGPPRWP